MTSKGLFILGHFMRFFFSSFFFFFLLDSYLILKWAGVNALQKETFEMDIHPIAQITLGGGPGQIPDKTEQV